MTSRRDKIGLAAAFGLSNATAIAAAAKRVDLPLALAFALIQGESNGRNIYGHDKGGALSTRGRPVTVCGETHPAESSIEVTPANYKVFLIMIGAGATSNGVGPGQITYARELPDGRSGGYHRLAAEEGLDLAHPEDNAFFSLRLFKAHLDGRSGNVTEAGTLYNAGNLRSGVNGYGLALAKRADDWQARW